MFDENSHFHSAEQYFRRLLLRVLSIKTTEFVVLLQPSGFHPYNYTETQYRLSILNTKAIIVLL